MQAALHDKARVKDTLDQVYHLTSGDPAYSRYHALYASAIWESCRVAR